MISEEKLQSWEQEWEMNDHMMLLIAEVRRLRRIEEVARFALEVVDNRDAGWTLRELNGIPLQEQLRAVLDKAQ